MTVGLRSGRNEYPVTHVVPTMQVLRPLVRQRWFQARSPGRPPYSPPRSCGCFEATRRNTGQERKGEVASARADASGLWRVRRMS